MYSQPADQWYIFFSMATAVQQAQLIKKCTAQLIKERAILGVELFLNDRNHRRKSKMSSLQNVNLRVSVPFLSWAVWGRGDGTGSFGQTGEIIQKKKRSHSVHFPCFLQYLHFFEHKYCHSGEIRNAWLHFKQGLLQHLGFKTVIKWGGGGSLIERKIW